jgi:4-oxalocrotonate tautomerase
VGTLLSSNELPGSRAGNRTTKGKLMPLVDIQLIEGVFNKAQKQEMIRKVTDAMVEIEGESMRGVTWVRVQELASGEWGIGGKTPSTEDIKAMQMKGA